jgi:hypothetical protein
MRREDTDRGSRPCRKGVSVDDQLTPLAPYPGMDHAGPVGRQAEEEVPVGAVGAGVNGECLQDDPQPARFPGSRT